MKHYDLALLGFGNVGQAFARLLMEKEEELRERYSISTRVTAIMTGSHGAAIDPEGIDLAQALELASTSISGLSRSSAPPEPVAFIKASGANVLFENTPVSYKDGEPALTHLRTALECGMHAITANKGPVVHGYLELTALAQSKGLKFLFESTVMDGAPVFSVFREALPAANVRAFQGVLNSTTNLILSRMEEGESFEDAVKYAQSIGIAETDPSGDVDGWDAAVKVCALATVMFGVKITPDQVDRTGIREITPAQIEEARSAGKRWKLVCRAAHTPDGVTARVAPEMVGPETAMYTVEGTTSIVTFISDVLGPLSIVEANPGTSTTAYGLLADFLNAVLDS